MNILTKRDTGTQGTPVQMAVTKLQGIRRQAAAAVKVCQGQAGVIQGSIQELQGARNNLKARELNKQAEDQEKEKKEIENGQATLKEIDPELARMVGLFQELYEPLNKLVIEPGGKIVEKLGKEDYPGALYESAKAALAIVKWQKLEEKNRQIQSTLESARAALDQGLLNTYNGISDRLKGEIDKMTGFADAAEGLFVSEKAAYDDLAKVVKENWKGNPKEGELAAEALRSIQLVQTLVRFLKDVQKGLPPALPNPGFNAPKAYTLATKGVGAPGAADLLQVAGYILGVRRAIDDEVTKWDATLATLMMVATKIGVQ